MMTDPIADLLTRIRNANSVGKEVLEIPASRIKANIAKVLKEEGYIKNFRLITVEDKLNIRIYLKFGVKGRKTIRNLKRVSRPGKRVYVSVEKLPTALNNMGTVIISTPRGVMTTKSARKARVGGEVLCTVW